MSTPVPRYIIVDDVDPTIQYTGSWPLSDQGSQNSVGNFGPAYNSTLHGTTTNASFSFEFSGSQVTVLGSNNILNTSGVLDPRWDCFIDDISIGATTPFAFPENNWVFCDHASLLDGPHILTVNATILKNQTFWFDDIQYVPSASVPLDQATIGIDNLDEQLLESAYGTGWVALGSTANMTTVAGSTFTFNFIGVSLSWYGFIPSELPLGPSSATYSIDGQAPIDFLLTGLTSNSTTLYNQKFFETGQLSPGSHTIKVVYEGNSTPLVLDYLVVQNGTLPSTTTTSESSSATTSNSVSSTTSTPVRSSATPVGAIAGGVVGGLALVVFAILGILFLRQRRRKRTDQEKVIISTPFEHAPLHPSSTTTPSSGGMSYPQMPQKTQFGSVVTYAAQGHAYHPSVTTVSQSIEPSNTSSGVTRTLPLQQTALILANPSLPSLPASASSAPSPPLKGERQAETPASLTSLRRGNPPSVPDSVQSRDNRLPNVVLHADSGIRMPPNTAGANVVTDVPPIYTPD